MIAQRNYANFFTSKCDCCKRVRKVKTKLEVVDEDGTLYGELTICPKCLQAFNVNKSANEKINGDSLEIDNYEIYDDEEMDVDDFKKLGYEVTQL